MGEDAALERLREILARPEYQVEQSSPWWAQLFGPVLELLSYPLARLVQVVVDTTSGRQGAFGVVVLVACGVLAVAVGTYLVRAVRLSVVRENRRGTANLAERRERSERLWQTAHQLAAAGQLAQAVRVLYLSALYALDERALLHVDSGLTNREHARMLSQLHPTIGQTFGEVVQHYDRVRYGRFVVTETTFAELSELVARARTASLQGSTT
jgi:Domain of unknown function (DUF4129)